MPAWSPVRHRLRWTLLALAAIVALAVALQPWWLTPLVTHRLAKSSGRDVHVDAMWVSLSASLEPVLQLRGVRVENAPWADRARPFASLAAVSAMFSWRSVTERRPIVALVVLRDGEVDLERREDGLRNWRLSHPDDRGPAQLKVLSLRGERTTLRFRHEPLALDLEVRTTPNSSPSGTPDVTVDPLPTRLVAHGTWAGAAFTIDAATSDTITLLETGRAARVRGWLDAGGARLDVDGSLGDIVRWPSVDAKVDLATGSLPRLVALFAGRAAVSVPEPLRGEGTLRGDARGYTLAVSHALLGASDVVGDVRWVRGDVRNTLRADLKSELLDLADLRALAVRRNAPTHPASGAASALRSAERAASAPASRSTDIDLRLAAHRVRVAGLPAIHDAALDASLAKGVARIARLAFGLGRGHVTAKATVALDEHPLRAEGEIDVSALPLETLLGEHAATRELSGLLHGRATLRTSGETIDALLAGASGTANASLSEGTISSLLDAQMGLQGGRIVGNLLHGAEPIPLHCAAVVVDVRKGHGMVRSLVIDSARTHTIGSGTVDLGRRTLDVVLTPQAKQPGLFVLERSIHIHGPITQPAHDLVARAARPSVDAQSCKPG